MGKCLSMAFGVLLVAVCAPYARADSIVNGTLYFTVTSGSLAPTASFVLDQTTDIFTSFTVDWDGAAFNFAGLTSAKLGSSGGWCGLAPQGVGPSCIFPGYFDLNGFIAVPEIGSTFTNPSAAGIGGYSVIETATPEPSSIALTLLWLGGLAVTLKRGLGGHRPAEAR